MGVNGVGSGFKQGDNLTESEKEQLRTKSNRQKLRENFHKNIREQIKDYYTNGGIQKIMKDEKDAENEYNEFVIGMWDNKVKPEFEFNQMA
jgi:hypothetical protein